MGARGGLWAEKGEGMSGRKVVQEGKIRLDFPGDWTVVKYDQSDWYRKHMATAKGMAGVDFLVASGKESPTQVLWIEVKDFRGFSEDEENKLIDAASKMPGYSDLNDAVKAASQTPHFKVERAKPSLLDSLQAKYRDTAAVLFGVMRAQAAHEEVSELRPFVPENSYSLQLIFVWGSDSIHAREAARRRGRLQDEMIRRLHWLSRDVRFLPPDFPGPPGTTETEWSIASEAASSG